MTLKRVFDFVISVSGILILSPALLFIALVIKCDSPGPVFFRQERVGRGGKLFRIRKFRTMTAGLSGLPVTVGGDPRITRSGAFLRKWKLDEVPQLIDVVIGHMSLVGPRPELPEFVTHYPGDARAIVLSVRPGITDAAALLYIDEEQLLARSPDPLNTYIEEVLPIKVRYYVNYVNDQSFLGDLRILLRTVAALSVRTFKR